MKLVDLNVLLYVVNQDAAHHKTLRAWWESALSGEEPIGLSWTVLLGFLRLSTNPKVFPKPITIEQAISKVADWIAHANIRLVSESEAHWTILKDLLIQTGTAGNLTTDAHLASLAIAQGAVLVSCDSDFGRFPKLRWENPLS